jgi:hypothetical protein
MTTSEITYENNQKWGAIPGEFEAVYMDSVNVTTYPEASILNDPKKISEIHSAYMNGEVHPEEHLLLNLGSVDNLGYNDVIVTLDV